MVPKKVTLQIVVPGLEKSKLSSDYAEAWVPNDLFEAHTPRSVKMRIADAQRYGLEDGAT
ncbi:MAG: hypothetical protein LLG15_10090 [Betaproteobacteria bacterium]|nr:hypothetical protein [Betaproteobacteria bacterium]